MLAPISLVPYFLWCLLFYFVALTICRLFHEESPVWHTINCNTFPKEYKEATVEGDYFQDEKIDMVTELVHPSGFNSEESAT